MNIHFIGIGGSIMHNIAIREKQNGNTVTGSDDAWYDPSESRLKENGLLPQQAGWFPEKITSDLDKIVLGMHAKANNPELLKAQELGIKIYSYPEYIYSLSENKERVVIAGSHGKSTITAMIMHTLRLQSYHFDYLIGAYVEGFDTTVQLSDAPIIIIEGDEYQTSPLDKTPKFLHYNHHIGVLSGIAWDHANVYPNFEGYKEQFRLFAENSVKAGALIYNEEDKLVREIVEGNDKIHFDTIQLPYKTHPSSVEEGKTFLKTELGQMEVPIFGEHNMSNLNAAKTVCRRLGIRESQFYDAMMSFRGASQRLELVGENENMHVFKDFAHSPSKVEATIKAVKKQYPKQRLTACMELHTFSSLNQDFIGEYANTANSADVAAVYYNPEYVESKGLPAISKQDLKDAFKRQDLEIFTSADELESFLVAQNWKQNNLLIMSSGKMGGMNIESLANQLLG